MAAKDHESAAACFLDAGAWEPKPCVSLQDPSTVLEPGHRLVVFTD